MSRVSITLASDAQRVRDSGPCPGRDPDQNHALHTIRLAAEVPIPAMPRRLPGPEEIEWRMELRLARQALLTQPGAHRLWAVIDESALRRQVGGPRVMCSQLERLIEVTKLLNVTLQILPFGAGAHSSMVGAFSILQFADDGLPDVVYLEHLTGAMYLDRRDHVDPYALAMERICVRSESPDKTADILGRIVNEICIH